MKKCGKILSGKVPVYWDFEAPAHVFSDISKGYPLSTFENSSMEPTAALQTRGMKRKSHNAKGYMLENCKLEKT